MTQHQLGVSRLARLPAVTIWALEGLEFLVERCHRSCKLEVQVASYVENQGDWLCCSCQV